MEEKQNDFPVYDEPFDTMLRAPAIIDGSTMVPVRFLAESLGMKVSWDGDARLITITSKG